MTGIAQPTLSNLEQGNISPTNNQRLLLEQALGSVAWPVNREFSEQERSQLVQAFAVLMSRSGPRQALDLLAATKNNDELRGIAGLFAPHIDVEVLTLPDHSRG
jgi:transcriptional regulator with XRE-family HTH domain